MLQPSWPHSNSQENLLRWSTHISDSVNHISLLYCVSGIICAYVVCRKHTNLWIFLTVRPNHHTLKPGDQICTSHVSHLIFLQFLSYLADYQNWLKRLDERDSLSQVHIHDRYEARSMMPTYTPSTRHQPPCNLLAGAQSIHDSSYDLIAILSQSDQLQVCCLENLKCKYHLRWLFWATISSDIYRVDSIKSKTGAANTFISTLPDFFAFIVVSCTALQNLSLSMYLTIFLV